MKRKPVHFEQSKEWYLRMAAIEEECDCDISAGKPIFYPPSITGWTPPEKPKRTDKPKPRAVANGTKSARRRRTTVKSRG